MSRTMRNKQVCEPDFESALASSPEAYGHLDLIAFGFPCQDLSIANPKGKGLAGERSSLFYEAIRIVRLLVPKWILIENVPGLLTSNKGMDFAIILNEVAESGYGYCWNVLDSQWFGVAQRRRRLFIAGRFGRECPIEILSEPKRYKRDVSPDDEASSASHCINTGNGRKRQNASYETEMYIAKTINTGQRGNNYAWRENHIAKTIDTGGSGSASAERNNYIAHVINTGGRRIGNYPTTEDYIARTITRNTGINNVQNDTLIARYVNTGKRTGSNGAQETYIAKPYADGKGAVAGTSRGLDTARGFVIGNAITVPVIEWIGKRMIMAINHLAHHKPERSKK